MILLLVSKKTCSKTKSEEDDLGIEDIKYDGAENLNSSPCGLFFGTKNDVFKDAFDQKRKKFFEPDPNTISPVE